MNIPAHVNVLDRAGTVTQVDLTNGDRTVVAGSNQGFGSVPSSPRRVAYNADTFTQWYDQRKLTGMDAATLTAIVALAAIRKKLRYSNIPPGLRGLGMTFILTGLIGIGLIFEGWARQQKNTGFASKS